MDCSRASDLMMIYFDRMLDEGEKNELFSHTKICGNCRAEFKLMEEILSRVDTLEDFIAPEYFEAEIMKLIDVNRYVHKRTIMPFIITGVALLFATIATFIYLSYGSVNLRESYSYVTSVTDWVSLSALLNQLGRMASTLATVWVTVLSNLPLYHKGMLGVYFALLMVLCSFFIGLQLILIKMTTGRDVNGGALCE